MFDPQYISHFGKTKLVNYTYSYINNSKTVKKCLFSKSKFNFASGGAQSMGWYCQDDYEIPFENTALKQCEPGQQ